MDSAIGVVGSINLRRHPAALERATEADVAEIGRCREDVACNQLGRNIASRVTVLAARPPSVRRRGDKGRAQRETAEKID